MATAFTLTCIRPENAHFIEQLFCAVLISPFSTLGIIYLLCLFFSLCPDFYCTVYYTRDWTGCTGQVASPSSPDYCSHSSSLHHNIHFYPHSLPLSICHSVCLYLQHKCLIGSFTHVTPIGGAYSPSPVRPSCLYVDSIYYIRPATDWDYV